LFSFEFSVVLKHDNMLVDPRVAEPTSIFFIAFLLFWFFGIKIKF